jgi:predicted dehydrogenase
MRVAVLGLGSMGRRHLQIVHKLGWDIVGIADQNEMRLSSAGQEYAIPVNRQYQAADRLLREMNPECVVVATTAPGHAPLTCLSAEAGARFILCEKPMACSLLECDQMIEVCKRYGTQLAINHQMRFMDQYLQVKRIVESEEFDGLRSITVVAGNFGIAMNGTHYFELFRWLTGEIPLEVSAWFSEEKVANPRGRQFVDSAGSIRMSTASGKRFYMEIGMDQGHGIRVIYAGRLGIMVADELSGRIELSVRGKPYRDLPTTRYGMPSEDRLINVTPADTVSPSRSVLEALVEGRDVPTGEDGRLAIETLVGAYVSNENGHVPIKLNDGCLPRDRRFPYA